MLRPAGYNATHACRTLYPLAAHQQSRKQHHACAAVCPRCIAVASCDYNSVFIGPSDLYSWGSLLLCDTGIHAATGTTKLLLLRLQCDCRGQPSVVESSTSFFGASFSISVYYVHIIPLLGMLQYCSWVRCITRGVLSSAFRHLSSAFILFSCRQPSVLCGRGLLRRERRNKDRH